MTPIDQPKTHLGQGAKKPWVEMSPQEYLKNSCSTGNLRTREIGPADSVGRIEPHGDKNEPDKICGGGNPRPYRNSE
jgi:hypothetical protein